MNLLTAPKVKKRSVEPLDFTKKAHRALLFDLALENQQHLLNDYDNDIVLIIGGYEYRQSVGELHAFIALVDDQPVGCFWIEVAYGVGRVRGALFNRFKNVWNGVYFMKWLVRYGFETVGFRKLDHEMMLYSKHDHDSAAKERLLKLLGFTKRAILPEALMVNGKPKDTILLDLLKRDYDVQRK